MTKKKAPKKPQAKPVIYVHAKGRNPLDGDQLQTLLGLGLTVCSRLEMDGVSRTTHGYDEPLSLLAELHHEHPGSPVIFLRAGLQPSQFLLSQLDKLARQTTAISVLVPLSNADARVNPFAGLRPAANAEFDYEGLVNLLAPGNLYTLTELPDHFAYFPAKTVARLTSAASEDDLPQMLLQAGVEPVLADHLFIHDQEKRTFTELGLKPHEHHRAPPFSELSARLQAWLDAGIDQPPVQATGKPATLHITHSWGGGVAQWIESFIQADRNHRHFQLRSENANSTAPFGLRLSLYAGNELRCPIASWCLQPPIESIAATDAASERILSDICKRFEVGRVFVSSLIGHSLGTLRTGLPTVQILHDHFPVWPLLGVNPEPYLSNGHKADLGKALSDNNRSRNFLDKGGAAWSRLCADYLQALTEFGVKIVAPGPWVIDLQKRLEPAFADLESKVIPHGFPVLETFQPIAGRPRKDGRLRMVILGRTQEGKGSRLLQQALPRLTEHVQVYLLGAGKPGEMFFGVSGVDVILEYDREKLGSLLETIGPDFAALLSVVPETFSYTLSELQQLGIPTVATRVGSFPYRVEHAQTGWLVEATADAVVEQVIALCQEPGLLESVRQNLSSITAASPEDMVKAYNRYCPPKRTVPPYTATEASSAQIQLAAADYQNILTGAKLRDAHAAHKKLALEIEKISDWAKQEQKNSQSWQKETERLGDELEAKSVWALQLKQDLEQQRKDRALWMEHLDIEINMYQERLQQTQSQLRNTQTDFANLQSVLQGTQSALESESRQRQQLQSDYEFISNRLETVLQSKSWKMTLPLRFARRVVKNFMLARAWNPLRWPWLLSSLVRTIGTQGLAGALRRMQAGPSDAAADKSTETAPAARQTPAAKDKADVAPSDAPGLAAHKRDAGTRQPVASTVIPGPFECPEQPDVSIIIPVYNQWPYTATCLASLLEARCRHSFEVIVVDDQSSDETQQRLEQVKGIKYLRNEQNQGFVGSCNRGAEHARGKFLVLLNNDTEVTDDWLDELIHVFDIEPRAGLVGSRLVYPDGKLQESGGIIFNDASGWNYGRGDDPERPEYKFLREADYCSGACIILKTAFFNELGALDERYSPAYYEDTDLAFRVREAGYKVLVQPASTVIHHEGATSGTDTSSGTKRYQLVNQEKFLDRWRDVLEHQPQPVPDPYNKPAIRKVSNHRHKGQILFIDAHTPEPDQDSGSVRLTNLMKICRELGYGVAFFADNRVNTGRYTHDLQKSGIEVLYKPWLQSLSEFFRGRGHEFDYIFISRHYVATNYLSMLKRFCPDTHFIFDTVDLHYLRERRLAELENSMSLKIAARQTRRAELNVVKTAAVTLVVSSAEKAVLAEDAPDAKVHILSNIHPVPGRDKAFSERKDIYFVGGFQHPPNIDAMQWFVNDVWPLIHAQLPDMQFHLIGSKAPDQVRELDGNGVVFHGFVESLEPFLNGCRLAIAPLRYGAGVKGKVNMSMAHGQPMVLTSAAAEGLFGEHEREYLLADDAESFAGEVIRLYQDEALWYRISDASINNVEEHFSIAAASASLSALFESFEKQ